jgi:hypothetical protein
LRRVAIIREFRTSTFGNRSINALLAVLERCAGGTANVPNINLTLLGRREGGALLDSFAIADLPIVAAAWFRRKLNRLSVPVL